MNWINIKERLPNAGQKVDLWVVLEDEEKSYRVQWTWEKQSTSDIMISGNKVTHWCEVIAPVVQPVRPKQLDEVDTKSLRDICQQYIDYIDSEEYHEDNDYDHYIFQATMEAVYGNNIWKFINNRS